MIHSNIVLVLLYSFLLKTNAKIKDIIMGGGYTAIDKYPHSAKLIYFFTEKPRDEILSTSQCGGSILNEYIILTAAHCVIDDAIMYAGVGHENMFACKYYRVSSSMRHESYKILPEGGAVNDISLLKLKQPLNFDKSVRKIKIIKSPPYNKPASIAGWGIIDANNNFPLILKHLRNLKVWSRNECNNLFNDSLPKGTLCAGDTRNINNKIFIGDSGSALVVQGNIQIGIASFSADYDIGTQQVYADVGYFYDWIQRTVKRRYGNKTKRLSSS